MKYHFKMDTTCKSKSDFLDEITLLMNKQHGIDRKKLLKDLQKREAEYSTGLESGFAIPHCRTTLVSEPIIVILKNKKDIFATDWETFDDSNVEMIISFIVPQNVEGGEMHLKLLSTFMRKLVDKDFQNKVKSAKDEKTMNTLISKIFD